MHFLRAGDKHTQVSMSIKQTWIFWYSKPQYVAARDYSLLGSLSWWTLRERSHKL